MRTLTGGSIAIMCPAFVDAAPCPLAQMGSAIQSQAMKRLRKPRYGTGSWIVGSTDRHLIQLFHPDIDTRFRPSPGNADKPSRASS
jgi:hypothetical protein